MRAPLEKAEQANITRLLRSMGAEVYVLGTRRPQGESQSTRQTPGLPDLIAFLKRTSQPPARDLVAIECKRRGGRLSPAQERFREACHEAGIAHVVGTLDDVIAFLIRGHYLVRENVAHYHLP